jgi:hypothetical protein
MPVETAASVGSIPLNVPPSDTTNYHFKNQLPLNLDFRHARIAMLTIAVRLLAPPRAFSS